MIVEEIDHTQLFSLLEIISDGKYHLPNELYQRLQWNKQQLEMVVHTLQTYGLPIMFVAGEGYRIQHEIELLKKESIQTYLNPNTKLKLSELMIFHVIESTNQFLTNKINCTSCEVCIAEYQTAGKGRHEKKWVTPFASNINLSFSIVFERPATKMLGVPLAIAVAVCEALKLYGINNLSVKWPNDILWHGKKLAGILLEMQDNHTNSCRIVMGIGINGHVTPIYANKIEQAWIDIYTITQKKVARNKLCALLINELIHCCDIFSREGFLPFKNTWLSLNAMQGKKIVLHSSNTNFEGIMQGISDSGELIIMDTNKQERRFISGDLSLRLNEE